MSSRKRDTSSWLQHLELPWPGWQRAFINLLVWTVSVFRPFPTSCKRTDCVCLWASLCLILATTILLAIPQKCLRQNCSLLCSKWKYTPNLFWTQTYRSCTKSHRANLACRKVRHKDLQQVRVGNTSNKHNWNRQKKRPLNYVSLLTRV